jgi:AraC family transcriptional activator of mtrCDE
MNSSSPRDAITEMAPLLRVRPELQDFCRFGGSWQADHSPAPVHSAYFHIVTRGRCLVERPGAGAIELEEGDVLVLTGGDEHVVRARGRRGATTFLVEYENSIWRKTTASAQVNTELICGLLHFEASAQLLMRSVLPEVIVLKAKNRRGIEHLPAMMMAIRDELDGGHLGALAIATELASALFLVLLRNYLEEFRAAEGGLVSLLADRATSKAVHAMIKDPARAWTLDDLASLAAVSRATLVRAFRKTAMATPLGFLSEHRLSLVTQRLRNGRDSLARIALETGFQSEASMSRAYLRRYGLRPGAARRDSQKESPPEDGERRAS